MLAALLILGTLTSADVHAELKRCSTIADSSGRLVCFDALASQFPSNSLTDAHERTPIPIELRARLDEYNPKLLSIAVGMIREQGWTCDSYSSMTLPGPGYRFTVMCNDFVSIYVFEDRGGQWRVRRQ